MIATDRGDSLPNAESSPVKFRVPQVPASSESGIPSGSSEETRPVEYVKPVLDQYDTHFDHRQQDKKKLQAIRRRHNFDQLGFEFGVEDERKTRQIAALLQETAKLEGQIEQEEEDIHRLNIEKARLQAEMSCFNEVAQTRKKVAAQVANEVKGRQEEMWSLSRPDLQKLRAEYLKSCQDGTNEELILLEAILQKEVEGQQKVVASLEEKKKQLEDTLAELQAKKNVPIDLSSNREIYLLRQDIEYAQRQLNSIRQQNRKRL